MASPDLAVHASSAEEDYKHFLLARVRSIHSDPLHSAAYLGNLTHFLKRPSREEARNVCIPAHQQAGPVTPLRPFVHEYEISDSGPPQLTTFDDVDVYKKKNKPIDLQNRTANELVVLTGRPSPEWLCAVGARYQLDHRFFHRHINFLPTGQRDWYTVPTLPSRSENVLRLCVPSILFVGENRYVNTDGLQKARTDCDRQIRQMFRSAQKGTLNEVGSSIVRRMNIHNGDSFVIEQELSACLIHRGENWTVLVWIDAGQDTDLRFLPAPATDQFKGALDRLQFCPVFFEKDLTDGNRPEENKTTNPKLKYPFALLPSNYGLTLKWADASKDPLCLIEELITFYAASEAQYLNMLQRFVEEQIGYAEATETKSNISSILHFDYVKSILTRHEANVQDLRQSLDKGLEQWKERIHTVCNARSQYMLSSIDTDLKYLSNRTQTAIALCEAGKSTIMSNKSIDEAQQDKEQAALVAKLTKATNRLTFIFLPISFVTSVFGMNFVQFGQGSLSITLWATITLPLLAATIVLVERGSYLKCTLIRLIKWLERKI